MIKRVLLSAASAIAIAACSGNPDSYMSSDFVTGPDGAAGVPVYGSRDPMVYDDPAASSDTREVRKELARKATDRVGFDFDSASLSADAQRDLTAVANYIKANGDKVKSVTIEGHCDERGTREYNLALGDRRAVSVKRFLVGLGIKASTINTISYGKERPVDGGQTEAAWAKNRRAVIVLN